MYHLVYLDGGYSIKDDNNRLYTRWLPNIDSIYKYIRSPNTYRSASTLEENQILVSHPTLEHFIHLLETNPELLV